MSQQDSSRHARAAAVIILGMSLAGAADAQLIQGAFTITSFNVQNFSTLNVERVNNSGAIVGSYDTASGATTEGYVISPTGRFISLEDPRDTTHLFTAALGNNTQGTITGIYFDAANNQYSGFLLRGTTYTTYNVPGLPPTSTTTIFDINELGNFCGYYAAPDFSDVGYVNIGGTVTTIEVGGAQFSACQGLNNLGQTVGFYNDGRQYRGYVRSRSGVMKLFDVPGAAGGPGDQYHAGTVPIGINDAGWISGHFFDASGIEHGFLRSPRGVYYQIDAPGATLDVVGQGTVAGGLNQSCTIVGHYSPGSGPQVGFIAKPNFSC